MGWKFKNKRTSELQVLGDHYDLVKDYFKILISDPEYGAGTFDDPKQRLVLETFAQNGLWDFDQLQKRHISAQIEMKLAREIARAIVEECATTADADPFAPEEVLASKAADFVALRAPAARLDMKFAVNRAERTILEASCSTVIFMVILEGATQTDSAAALEATAQSIGLIWVQWLNWNKALAFAAFNGQDKVP